MKRFFFSFVYAGRGFWYCMRHERNFRVHLAVAAYVLAFAPSFVLTRGEWAALLLTIALVVTAEGFNTAIERAVNINAQNRFHPLARAAKDASAGMVLFGAVISIAVAGVLFYRPDFISVLGTQLSDTETKLLFVLSIPVSFLFIICGGKREG